MNAIEARITTLDWATAPVFEINGLKREELIAAGSVILHEAYFDRLAADGGDPPAGLGHRGGPGTRLRQRCRMDSRSSPRWPRRRRAGPDWTTLVWSDRLGRLINQWSADHAHALAGGAPILALDMYEHAYHLDFGTRAAAYVDAVMGNLHWERIAARYRQVRYGEAADVALFTPFGSPTQSELLISAEALRADMERDPPALLDVCLAVDLPRRRDMLPGATMHNPKAIDHWAATLPRDKPIVVYCFFGFQISGTRWRNCATAASTRAPSRAGSAPGTRSAGQRYRWTRPPMKADLHANPPIRVRCDPWSGKVSFALAGGSSWRNAFRFGARVTLSAPGCGNRNRPPLAYVREPKRR